MEGATYRSRSLMNRDEYRIYQTAERAVRKIGAGHLVFAQVSLGEILASEDTGAFRAINSKRVDILVIDRFGQPRVVVGYQGSGHYLSGDAELSDRIKRLALENAGIHYLDVHPPLDGKALSSQLIERLQTDPQVKRPVEKPTAYPV